MNQYPTDSNQVTAAESSPKKPKKGCCLAITIAIIIFLTILTYFAVLVIKHIRNLNTSTNQQSTSAITAATEDDPFKGGINAKVVIVEFGDFQCLYCRDAFTTTRDIMSTYGDKIKFIFRDFPIAGHPDSQKAAEAGECAHEQGKFWEMHDKLFINHTDLSVLALKSYAQQIGLDANQFNNCLDSDKYKNEVIVDLNAGLDLGVEGTPTFIINNKRYTGAIPLDSFKQIIDAELAL